MTRLADIRHSLLSQVSLSQPISPLKPTPDYPESNTLALKNGGEQ